MTFAGTPAARARSRARAWGWFEMTTPTSASMAPLAQASRIACKLVPLPETRTPSFSFAISAPTSESDPLLERRRVGNPRNLADEPGTFPLRSQEGAGAIGRTRLDHHEKADTEV